MKNTDAKEESVNKIDMVLEAYCDFVKSNQTLPTGNDLKDEIGLTKKAVEHHFGNYERLLKAAKEFDPSAFKNIFMPEDFTGEKFEEVRKDIRKYKRYVVTTAVCGAKVNRDFYASLKNYCKRRNAKLLILPSGTDLIRLDPILKGEAIITHELFLNSNIKLDPVILNPKVLRPMSGLSRIGQRSCSVIFGAPKLTKESIATDNGKYPHIIMTSGAITNPSYSDSKRILKKKVDKVAENDHDLACVVIEIADGVFFHEREMQADTDGSIVDLTMKGPFRYHANGKVTAERALNANFGDWHCGETSQITYDWFPKLAKLTKAETISLHDVLSMMGHTHHTKHDRILSAQIEEAGQADPVAEIQMLADDLKMWLKACDSQIYIVGSNHPEHLNRAVSEGTLDQPNTYRTYLELALAMIDGHDPMQWGLKRYAEFDSKRVTFLGRDDRHVLKNRAGEMSLHFHGDKGPNGSKGGGANMGMSIAVGCCVVGHTHTPRIEAGGTMGGQGNGGVWTNGTATCIDGEDRPQYSKGSPSSWMHTSTFTYGSKTGRFLRQQITLIGGTWTIDGGQQSKSVKDELAHVHRKIAESRRFAARRGLKKAA